MDSKCRARKTLGSDCPQCVASGQSSQMEQPIFVITGEGFLFQCNLRSQLGTALCTSTSLAGHCCQMLVSAKDLSLKK